jgi:hypothetical protein
MPRPFGAVPNIINSIASPINVAFLDQNWAQLLTDFNDSSIGYTNWGVDTGIANAYAVTIAGPLSAYATGMVIAFSPANSNTGASTINVNGIGTVSILDVIGNTPVPGEILAGRTTYLVYNGTVFLLVNSSITGGVSYSYDWDDFLGNPKFLATTASGSGTSVSAATTQQIGHPGLLQFVTATGTGNYARAYSPGGAFLDTFTWTVRCILEPTVIGTGSTFLFGLDSTPGQTGTRNAVEFFGQSSAANWQCQCYNAVTSTVTNSGIPFSASTWYDLMLVANAGTVTFYINGSSVATITTNIPASTSLLYPFVAITGGTSSGSGLYADTFEILATGIPFIGSNPFRFLKGPV